MSSRDPGRFGRLRELFREAASLAPEAWEEFATAHAAGDPQLRQDLLDLLRQPLESSDSVLARGRAVVQSAEAAQFGAMSGGSLPAEPRFEVLGEIGRGAMGVVYRARDRLTGAEVALKKLPPSVRRDREILALARLDHPGIVRLRAIAMDDDVPAAVMELAEGPTLARLLSHLSVEPPGSVTIDAVRRAWQQAVAGMPWLEGKVFDPGPAKNWIGLVLHIALDLANALHHAHGRGILHRDIKPANVALRWDGRAQILDLGLARIAGEASVTRSGAVGTPAYASPEQISGVPELDGRTDVYGLGVTIYELLTFVSPFRGETPIEVLRQIDRGWSISPRSLNPSVPRDLATVCLQAFDRDRSRRYQSAGELAADLRNLLDYRHIHARAPGAVRQAVVWGRRHPVSILAALVLLAAGTGFVARDAHAASVQRRTFMLHLGAAREAVQSTEHVFRSIGPGSRRLGDALHATGDQVGALTTEALQTNVDPELKAQAAVLQQRWQDRNREHLLVCGAESVVLRGSVGSDFVRWPTYRRALERVFAAHGLEIARLPDPAVQKVIVAAVHSSWIRPQLVYYLNQVRMAAVHTRDGARQGALTDLLVACHPDDPVRQKIYGHELAGKGIAALDLVGQLDLVKADPYEVASFARHCGEVGRWQQGADMIRRVSRHRRGSFPLLMTDLQLARDHAANAADRERAALIARALLESHPDREVSWIALARAEQIAHGAKAALEHYQQAVDEFPRSGLCRLLLGRCQREAGDRATALASFREASACDPTLAEAHAEIGTLVDDPEERSRVLAKAIDLDPGLTEPRHGLAAELSAQRRWQEACAVLEPVFALDWRASHCHDLYSVCKSKLQEFATAAGHDRAAAELGFHSPQILTRAAKTMLRTGAHHHAAALLVDALTRLSATTQPDEEMLALWTRVRTTLGRPDDGARLTLLLEGKTRPSDDSGDLEEWMLFAQVCARDGNWRDAASSWRRALTILGSAATPADWLDAACALARAGDLEGALSGLREGTALLAAAPDDSDARKREVHLEAQVWTGRLANWDLAKSALAKQRTGQPLDPAEERVTAAYCAIRERRDATAYPKPELPPALR